MATVQDQVQKLGNGLERYTYTVANLTLQANEEIDFEFDPKLFGVLSDPLAGNQFSVLVLQPNNPAGAPGEFSVAAISDDTAAVGPFSVDFTYIGAGAPGSQLFEINQYDSNGNFEGLVASGTTTLLPSSTPEPSTFGLAGVPFALYVFYRIRRRPKSCVRDLC